MRERSSTERGDRLGRERRSFSAARRVEGQGRAGEVAAEESRAWERRERAWRAAGSGKGSRRRAAEKMRWRRSGWERASSKKVVMGRRTAPGVTAVIVRARPALPAGRERQQSRPKVVAGIDKEDSNSTVTSTLRQNYEDAIKLQEAGSHFGRTSNG